MGDDEPTRAMSYGEIASALALKLDSAKRMVRRKRWRRLAGNDGRVRIAVPLSALPPPDSPAGGNGQNQADTRPAGMPSPSPDKGSDSPPDVLPDALLVARLAQLEIEIAALREVIAAERARADAAALDRDRWHDEATRPLLAKLFRRRAA